MKSTLFTKAPAISADRERELLAFKETSGITIENLELLNLAFTHRSFANETNQDVDNNERLEFLGDSILGMCVADWLFRNLPAKQEGDFSKIKSVVVSEDSLAMIARSLGVDRYLLLGKGEEHTGGRDKKALLADCMEALFAACYLDSGFVAAQEFVMRYLEKQIRSVLEDDYKRDYKTSLQEYMQKRYARCLPIPWSRRQARARLHLLCAGDVNGQVFGPAQGTTRKKPSKWLPRLPTISW